MYFPTGLRPTLMGMVAVLVWLTAGSSVPASAQIYDAAKDFSFVENPNGAWRYGSSADLDSPFVLSSHAVAHGNSVAGWSSAAESPGYPFTLTAAFNVQWGTSLFAPGWLSLHPESFGAYNVVKWIASKPGLYQVKGVFDSFNSRATGRIATVNLHLRHNQSGLWQEALNESASRTETAHTLKLNAGDHLDFVVGSAGSSDFDTVGFQATVTYLPPTGPLVPVPEPRAIGGLAAVCLGAFAVFRRRRHRACA
jgi:hypothetical protein